MGGMDGLRDRDAYLLSKGMAIAFEKVHNQAQARREALLRNLDDIGAAAGGHARSVEWAGDHWRRRSRRLSIELKHYLVERNFARLWGKSGSIDWIDSASRQLLQ
jgi:hypothetical protein